MAGKFLRTVQRKDDHKEAFPYTVRHTWCDCSALRISSYKLCVRISIGTVPKIVVFFLIKLKFNNM